MFRLFNIFSVAGRKLLLLSGSYDLRTDVLQGHWEQVASAFLKIRPRSFIFTQELGTPTSYQVYTISGIILEGVVTITAPEGYELHPVYNPPYTENVGWERQIIITPDENMRIAVCTIRVRLNSSEEGIFGGKIKHVSTNLLTQYIYLTGECKVTPPTQIKYGLLYNWYVLQGTEGTSIIPAEMEEGGWKIAKVYDDWNTLFLYMNSEYTPALLEELNELALSLRSSTENPYKFNLRDFCGYRLGLDGGFEDYYSVLHGADSIPISLIFYEDTVLRNSYVSRGTQVARRRGGSVRLVRNTTFMEDSLPDGSYCPPYIGNDGKSYRTTKIGTQVWLADNLAETKYRNGEVIPNITSNEGWISSQNIEDWYVPSIGDLQLLYTLSLQGLFNFIDPEIMATWYASSSEYDKDNYYGVDFTNGNTMVVEKQNSLAIMPVRHFQMDFIGQYAVGDRGPSDGWIYRIDSLTCYEVGPQVMPTSPAFSNIVDILAGTSLAVGVGLMNCIAIVEQQGHTGSQAKLAMEYASPVAASRCCAYDNDPNNV